MTMREMKIIKRPVNIQVTAFSDSVGSGSLSVTVIVSEEANDDKL
jgi:hypothetical protein